MNTSQLKSYAPRARKEFIAAVTAQAARLGIADDGILPGEIQGDVLMIGGRAWPRTVHEARATLVDRVRNQGFAATMEAVAYTWFNRFMAIRYMELQGYLEHGYRVLSHPEGTGRPEILEHATDVALPGIDPNKVVELKLEGTKDEELYRLLLKAQCNALNTAMPFLFERIGGETELLLPANLLHSDSLVRDLVNSIDEEAWQDIEIIGWLYQFYISEKKDQVIGKVVKSEDIPAATQLFTPNWIVKYMVQNSLGAQWLATYPDSPLKGQMEYYIEPAEQTPEVRAQLDDITPDNLNPEELTLMDPACGSGHILVEAYDLFKAIYLERGYRLRDIPKLILEKNLYGLDIDERAAQMAGFALMMKGRADDRRLFDRGVKLNVMALVDSAGFDAEGLARSVGLAGYGLQPEDLSELKRLFEHATTFGSLIQLPEELVEKLPGLKQLSDAVSHDIFVSDALKHLGPLVLQAQLLAVQYDAVVANPPYMGVRAFTPELKSWLKAVYQGFEKDLFAAFISRQLSLTRASGYTGVMTSFVWMFLASYEQLRLNITSNHTINSLVQLHYDAFADAKAHVCTFTLQSQHVGGYRSSFVQLSAFPGVDAQSPKTLQAIRDRYCGWFFEAVQDDFKKVPGDPIVFSAPRAAMDLFLLPSIDTVSTLREGIHTGRNELFLRSWSEVDYRLFSTSCLSEYDIDSMGKRWVPYNKGGTWRKWFGNNDLVICFDEASRDRMAELPGHVRPSKSLYFREGGTWSALTSGNLSLRYYPSGFLFDSKGQVAVGGEFKSVIGLLNSSLMTMLAKLIMPTMDYKCGDVRKLPFLPIGTESIGTTAQAIRIAQEDWDAYERSWDFQSLPFLKASGDAPSTLESTYAAWSARNRDTVAEMKRLEEENNRQFIDAYGLGEELTPDVPIEQITLTVNPAYRYGTKNSEQEQWTRFRQDTMRELISYAVGCMMGRYSLDDPGLIYAHSGNEGFDHSKYPTFPADDDGIVPITDTDWFEDDAANRLFEFIEVAWDAGHLEDNLSFLAENLSPRKNETARGTIRRYLCDKFFADHLKTYKKRPIYWLFISGKQKAFQCLVYLHRYNEGTLARMRSEYVIPLQGKMAARIEKLTGDIGSATSSAHRKRLEKEREKLRKQQVELLAFDEKLRHYADKRIALNLDDGVKVNYGKFGDMLAEVKKVHGKKPEDV